MALPQPLRRGFTSLSLPRSSRLLSTTTTTTTTKITQDAYSNGRIASTQPHTVDPRWLMIIKRRIGRCMMFGLKPHQVREAGEILRQLAWNWRELVAGSEGYLTDVKRRASFRHNVVWGEMDAMGIVLRSKSHLHPVTTKPNGYAETARVNFVRNLAMHVDPAHKSDWMNLVNSTGIGLILRSIKIDYKFPMKWPDKVTVYQKLVQDPSMSSDSAFKLDVMILSEARQRPAARCHEDTVMYDYRLAQKMSALPPFVMEQFKAMWELQEEAKRVWQQRIVEIEEGVRKLEVESWDREDAVEDMGSASR